ncbi:transcriptional regulator [Bacillus sp. FJAT-27264]|uniref:helix-turn-helix domain-containing protein n=1 Tax=Paenibacillus sp. (strain DSM 101736 / FJAT-27264) TaxID=1850362 RepID=UPI000807CB3B|nr:helix-turn-helix domain-containing protein [Bacillus sp. FJAT-27264]OBZ07539.1 transcriptional regulator [Bacillus sp. FJAT-27264]
MEPTTTITAQLESFLKEEKTTVSQFAEVAELHTGTLSNILNDKKTISMQQLDKITLAMRLEEGHFYDLYIQDCFFHSSPDWRRLGPYLNRCAELNKLDCIRQTVHLMLDRLSYAPLLFEAAEEFFRNGKRAAALILYECLAETERYQHSERLALCHYRLFIISLCEDQDLNTLAAIQFEPYIDRLDEIYQLDALNELINVNVSLHRWNAVELLSQKMGHKAMIQYEQSRGKSHPYNETNKPLVFYVLYAYLSLGNVYSQHGDYEKALEYVDLYGTADWVDSPSDEEVRIIYQFHEWSEANRYMYKLMRGQVEVLPEYIDYLSNRQDEVFVGLCRIVAASNTYHFNIDPVLERFDSYFLFKQQEGLFGNVNSLITMDRHTRLLAELGVYYLNNKKFQKGLLLVLESLESSIKIKCDSAILRCVGLFEQFRHQAPAESQDRYTILIREVHKLNEKKIGCSLGYM